jgi:predicted short-subunit dehydrogenase-like oxidoreductase (DUF2520 family)
VRLVIAGPGRAGGALAIAAASAGHELVGLFSRSPRVEAHFAVPVQSYDQLSIDRPIAPCDLLIIAARDTAIAVVAELLTPFVKHVTSVVHLSGFASVGALDHLARLGIETGSFHPLQSLPDPIRGAEALSGSWVAITAGQKLAWRLNDFASSLSLRPFALADEAKPAYHAGAAAASNYVIAALDLAGSLLEAAGVPFKALEPLTLTVIRNAFSQTPALALTGPIARGDWDTVAGHMQAANLISPAVGEQFRLMAEATAITAKQELPQVLSE